MATTYSRAKLAGHPIHPMLVAFPVTFYTTTLLGFAAYALTENGFWWQVGLWSNAAGFCTGVLASIPGFIDWWYGIPRRSAARRAGKQHMLLILAAQALFLLNLLLQWDMWTAGQVTSNGGFADAGQAPLEVLVLPDASLALLLSAGGFALTVVAGFLGWTMVQVHHVGVDLTDEQRRLETPARGPARPLVQS